MDTLLQDLRYAARALLKSPGFTIVAILTLGLGIGANTAVFTLVNAALFRAPPGDRPHELVWLAATVDFPDQPGRPRSYQRRFSMPEYRDYAAGATAFSGLTAYQDVALALGSGGEPERINGMLVSGNYFQVLGLVPAAGRFFVPEEDRDPGAHPVVVLSHGLWSRRFGSDSGIVGTDITVNVEGFWMLQALLDIRHVAPELRCRPFVSTDSMEWLNGHPGMAIMREQGIVDGETVNDAVAARMRVLAAPDLEIVALLSRGKLLYGVKEKDEAGEEEQVGSRDIPDNEFRVLLARRGQHWVSAVRVGDEITVDDVAIADTTSIATLVFDALESIHHAEPAAINAVNVPLDEMLEVTKAWQSSGFNVFSGGDLRRLGISAATVAALGQALSDPGAEAAVYARQYRDDDKAPSASVLSLKDGSGGRIAMYQQGRTAGSNEAWLAICPATPQLVQVGVKTVLETLPYGEWKTHSRV